MTWMDTVEVVLCDTDGEGSWRLEEGSYRGLGGTAVDVKWICVKNKGI